jgi:hypothetical protein
MDSDIRISRVPESYIPAALAVWIFHRMVPSLVLKTVGIMHRVRRAFETFDDSNQDLTQFIEHRVFPRCDQFLVSSLSGIELGLA